MRCTFTLDYFTLFYSFPMIIAGSSDLLSASEDFTDGVLWFWELRDLKKALHTSLSADSHPAPHTSGHIPAPSSLFIPPMAAKDAAKAKKMTDLIRKRRKDLSVLLLSINESISLLSQSTLPTTKSHESKLMKSFTKLYKSSSLDEIEEGMRKGLEELGGKYQAQAQAIQRKLEEKEAKKSEKEAKKIEKVEEKKISKTGFGDKKSLDSARRVMTQFFGKTPVGKGPVAALAFTPAGGGALLSPECQVMPPPPPPGLGSASAARSSLKGSRAGPSFHTPQE